MSYIGRPTETRETNVTMTASDREAPETMSADRRALVANPDVSVIDRNLETLNVAVRELEDGLTKLQIRLEPIMRDGFPTSESTEREAKLEGESKVALEINRAGILVSILREKIDRLINSLEI